MLNIIRQILRTGIVTEEVAGTEEPGIIVAGEAIRTEALRRFKRSVTIRFVDAGSCNACELELQAVNNPIYDCERFGIRFTASPRFADILLVTGPVARNMEVALLRTYDAMPEPRIVVAMGGCAYDGGVFGTSYASLGSVGSVIPVNLYIKGCPPSPSDILNGILAAIRGLGRKGGEGGAGGEGG